MILKFLALFILGASAPLPAALGQREASLRVIETMRSLQPLYKQLQAYVVNQLSEASANSSNFVNQLYTDVIQAKEQFIHAVIDQEHQVQRVIEAELATNDIAVNPTCLGFVRRTTGLDVDLAGVSASNCIVEMVNSFNETLGRFRQSLQGGEMVVHSVVTLFGVFRGENIFSDPERIIVKLNERTELLAALPAFLASALLDFVEGFAKELKTVLENYKVCLDEGMHLLNMSLSLARTQIVKICMARLSGIQEE